MSTERTRGITLRLLDFSTFTAKITGEQDKYETLKIDHQYALGTDSQGNVFGLCAEGVGSSTPLDNEDHGLLVDWHGENPTDTGYSISMVPVARYSFDLSDLAEFETGETVDLADFVRAFGARLESNFWNWFGVLSK